MSGVDRKGVLAGQVAVVTGASRGIGEAIAVRYALAGARVLVSACSEQDGEHELPGGIRQVVDRIQQAGAEATAVRCDLGKTDQRERLIQTAESVYGSVDIRVNNAAITFFNPRRRLSREAVQAHARGPALCALPPEPAGATRHARARSGLNPQPVLPRGAAPQADHARPGRDPRRRPSQADQRRESGRTDTHRRRCGGLSPHGSR